MMNSLLDVQQKVDAVPAKLKWLKGIIHKLGVKKVIDPALCMGMMLYIENLQGKLEEGKQLNKNELTECNNILKLIRERYGFDIDWRDDIQKDFEHLII